MGHKSLQGWHKTRFCCFASKIQLLSTVCYKVSLCENFQRPSCSHMGMPLSNGPYMDCGRRSRLPKICAQSDPPLQKNTDFGSFHLRVHQPSELAEKIQLSLTGSRQCAFHRAIDESCALPLSPRKGGSKREFLHLAMPFISSLQVIVDTSNLVCWLIIASPSLQTTNFQ